MREAGTVGTVGRRVIGLPNRVLSCMTSAIYVGFTRVDYTHCGLYPLSYYMLMLLMRLRCKRMQTQVLKCLAFGQLGHATSQSTLDERLNPTPLTGGRPEEPFLSR